MSRTGIAFVCVALGVSSIAWAQVTTGTISGTVADETGGVLPGVEITVRNVDTGVGRAVISDDEGRYRASSLTLGSYEVQAALAGFQTGVRTGITLNVGSEAIVDITLQIGEISERVVVEGEAPLVESTSSAITGLVDNQTIRSLPLNGRSFTQLAALQEGVGTPVNVVGTQPGNEGLKISIAGTRTTETAFLLDGTDIRGNFNTTPGSVAGVLLGVDTVREFSVVTGIASAEYGGFTGGVINAVTRSGTNVFHGSVFEFHRNSALDARNFFDREAKTPLERSSPPNFIRNQFGVVASGPIIPDKTFFIGSYEGLRDRLTTTQTSIVPDENARNGILPSGPIAVAPSVQPYLDLYPLPNAVNFGDGRAEWVHASPVSTDEDYFMAKIDHNFSDADSLFVRYTFDDSQKFNLTSLQNFEELRDTRTQYVTIEEKKILSPSLINEARFAFNRFRADSDFEPLGVDPSLKFIDSSDRTFGSFSVSGQITGWGGGGLSRLKQTLNRFEFIDNLVYTTGRHSIKTGFKYTRIQFNLINCLFCAGSYTFRTLPDFLQARPIVLLATLGFIDPPSGNEFPEPPFVRGRLGPVIKQGMRQNLFGFYVQDDFKWMPNLTLNLGFRYEFFSHLNEVNGNTSNLDEPLDAAVRVGNPILARNPSKKSFSPRIGFAWDPRGDGKISLRGGFGIFYDFFGPNRFLGAQTSAPFFNRVAPFFPPGFPKVVNAVNDQVIQSGSGVFVFKTPNQPYVMQFNLTLQWEPISQTVVTLGYQGSRGVKLSRMSDVNQAPVEVNNGRYFWPADGVRQNPNFQMIRMFSFDVNSFYHSARVGLKKRFGQGFQLQSSYTFSRSIDDASNTGPFDGPGAPNGTGNVFFDQKVDRALSSFNVTHRYSFNGLVELPFGAGKAFGSGVGGAVGKLISGWQLSSIVTLATGPPTAVRVSFGRSRSRAAPDITERPDLVVGADNNPVLSDGRDPNRYFDVSSFVLQPEGFWGNVGRNTLIGPGLATVDLSLMKDTVISERTTLQFRAEFFNIANRANFGEPSRTVFSNPSGIPNSDAGRITTTTTTSRQIQFALKLLF